MCCRSSQDPSLRLKNGCARDDAVKKVKLTHYPSFISIDTGAADFYHPNHHGIYR